MTMSRQPSATKHVRRRLAIAAVDLYLRLFLQFILVAVLARLLTPKELGIYAVGMSFVLILESLRDFGVGRYLVQVRDLTREAIRAVMGITMVMGLGVAAVLAIGAGPFAEFYDEPGLRPLIWVLALNAVLLPLNTPVMAVLERELRYKALFFIRLAGGIVGFVTTIALAMLGHSYMSMAWGSVATTLALILATSFHRPGQTWVLPSLHGWGPAFSFGGMTTLAGVAASTRGGPHA